MFSLLLEPSQLRPKKNAYILSHYALAIPHTKVQSTSTRTGLVNDLQHTAPNFNRLGFSIAHSHLNWYDCIDNEKCKIPKSLPAQILFPCVRTLESFEGGERRNSGIWLRPKDCQRSNNVFVSIYILLRVVNFPGFSISCPECYVVDVMC